MSIKAVGHLQGKVKMKQRLISCRYLRDLREHSTTPLHTSI